MIKEIPRKKYLFVLEVDHGFNAYDFFIEFKKIQEKGFFPKVKHITKLDENEIESEILPEEDVQLSDKEREAYGIK